MTDNKDALHQRLEELIREHDLRRVRTPISALRPIQTVPQPVALDILQQLQTVEAERDGLKREVISLPEGLHPNTANLIRRFSIALAEKLRDAEVKYGYSDKWKDDDWMEECQENLLRHVDKGDPRDVAAYCAFLWHHGAPTTLRPVVNESNAARDRALESRETAWNENIKLGKERDALKASNEAKDARIVELIQHEDDPSEEEEAAFQSHKQTALAASQARCAALEEEHRWIARNLHSCPACTCEGCKITMDEAAYRSKHILSTPSDTAALDAVAEKAIRKGVAALDEFADADNDDPKTDWISGHNLNYHPEVMINIMLRAAGLGDKEKP